MDADATRAEFAVTVRSDRKRRGLGCLCLEEVIVHARRRGVELVRGEILRENAGMIGLARRLGFEVAPDRSEPKARRAELRLGPV